MADGNCEECGIGTAGRDVHTGGGRIGSSGLGLLRGEARWRKGRGFTAFGWPELHLDGNGLDGSRIGVELAGDLLGETGELQRLGEANELRGPGVVNREAADVMFQRHVFVEHHEPLRDAGLLGEFDEVLAALLLLDLGCAGQQRFEVAILGDELGRGLDADAGDARHVVDRVARQRLDVDDLVGRHAEFFQHLGLAHLAVLHGVIQRHAGADQLHQVLVGGDDAAGGAGLHRLARIGGDQVIGLVIRLLHTGDVEGAGGLADQAELRAEIGRRLRPLRLVLRVDVVAERFRGMIEDHREVGGLLAGLGFLQQLPQHVAEALHGADGQAIGLARERRQRVVGAENIPRAIDEIEMVAGLQGRGAGHGPTMPFRLRRCQQMSSSSPSKAGEDANPACCR